MNNLIESPVVKEEEHLVPNLPNFAKEVFGENSYFIKWESPHKDPSTGKLKKSDGLIWLPWKSQLWVIEVEWKLASNFFEQTRAFACSEISENDEKKYAEKLTECLSHTEKIFNDIRGYSPGFITSNIVEKTLKKHIKNGYLRPHGWILLGHEGGNKDKLREDYRREVRAWFNDKEGQQYIVTTTRMFNNDFSTYFLLDHYFSRDLNACIPFPKPALITGKLKKQASTKTENLSVTPDNESQIISSQETTTQPRIPQKGATVSPYKIQAQHIATKGRAYKFATLLSKNYPGIKIDNIGLRLQYSDDLYYDFKIAWYHSGNELLIIDKNGVRNKPANTAKKVFGSKIPPDARDIADTIGYLIDISDTPAKKIVSHKVASQAIQKGLDHIDYELQNEQNILQTEKEMYFATLDSHKIKRIREHIIGKRKLWEKFLEKGEMIRDEFHDYYDFKPKSITGFIQFLTDNGIAKRSWNSRSWHIYTLEENVNSHIQRCLKEY